MATQSEIKTAVDKAKRVLAARPEEGKMTKGVTLTLEDGTRCRAEDDGYSVLVDMPEALGGENVAPNPGFYLRTAIASCTLITFIYGLTSRQIPYSDVSVRVEQDMDVASGLGVPKAHKGVAETRIIVRIVSSAERSKIEDALAEAQNNGIVNNVVRPGARIKTELVVAQSQQAAE